MVRAVAQDSQTTMRPIGTRIPELDSLRGFAAIGVVLWHYSSHFNARPLDALFRPFYDAGFYLVDFFFVLSGFVLTRAYLNEDRQYRCTRNILDRVARLYPLHILTLVVVMLGQLYVTTITARVAMKTTSSRSLGNTMLDDCRR